MVDARKGGWRPKPHEAPRPGFVWRRCWMCGRSGKTLSRWTTELGGKWIRCPNCFGKGWVQEPDKPRSPARPKNQARASSQPPSLLTGADYEALEGLVNRDLPSPGIEEARTSPPKTPSAFPRTGLYQGSPPHRPSSPPRRGPKKRRGIGYGWVIALVIAALVLGGAGYVAYLEYLNGSQTTPLVAALYLTPTPTYAPTSAPGPPTSTPVPAVPTLSKSGFQPVRLGVLPPTATPTATSVPPIPVTTWTPITVKSSGRLVATPTPYQPIAVVVLAGSPTPRPPTATPRPSRASTPGPVPTATWIADTWTPTPTQTPAPTLAATPRPARLALKTTSPPATERILVDREVWECYSHRPREPIQVEGRTRDSCGGWKTPTVVKWRNDAPVKVWATGDPDYVAVLKTVLTDLAPILRLEFKWVSTEAEADLKAFMGVPRSQAPTLGFAPRWTDFGGFASAHMNGGEATSGYMVVWRLRGKVISPADVIRSIIIHEALHALIPIGHSTRPVSIMGGSGLTTWSPMDKKLMDLNSHPALKPGMTMEQVRELIVLTDEPRRSDDVPSDPLQIVWRAYTELEEAGTASFRLSGGWVDRHCNHTFGVRRGPVEWTVGNFRLFEDDPALAHLNFHTEEFFVAYSHKERAWLHWQRASSGTWERVAREVVVGANSWWLWQGKLHRAIRSLLKNGTSDDIHVKETDGNLVLSATLGDSYPSMWDWTGIDALDFTLVLDPESFAIRGYTWERRKNAAANPGKCLIYREVATDGRMGVDLEVPDAVKNGL